MPSVEAAEPRQSERRSLSWWLVRAVAIAVLAIEAGWTLLIWGWLIVAARVCPDVGGSGYCNGRSRLFIFVMWGVTQFALVPLAAGAIAALAVQQSKDRRVYRG